MTFFPDYPRISAALMEEPWAIVPEHHRSLVRQLEAFVATPAVAALPSQRDRGPKPLAEGQLNYITTFDPQSRLGLINVHGVIGKGLSTLAMDCGGVDLNQIQDGLDQLTGLSPRAVLMHFNSPGGTVTGLQETAAAIDSFRTSVAPVFGYTDSMACSAAYWLATACDTFHTSASALIGSIGVMCAITDSSQQAAAEGRKVHVITSGEQKARGYPGVPVTEAQLNAIRASVSRMEARFFGQVQSRRPGVDPAIAFTGDYWPAQDSPAGLADGFLASRKAHIAFVQQTLAAAKR